MRIDSGALKARLKDIEQALHEENLEALVVYANGSALGAGSKMHGYMRYLTNFDSHNTGAVLVLRPGHEPVIVIAISPTRVTKSRELLWFTDIRVVKPAKIGDEIVAILGADRPAPRRIGYIGRSETTVPVWESLQTGLPGVEWIDFAPRIDSRRVVKSGLQRALHSRAAEICDAIFQTVQREVRSGLKGYQLQAEMEGTARKEGCEYCSAWLTVEPRADYARFFTEECGRVPQYGDQVIAGIYLTYDGHWGHAIRTGTVGKPTPDHRRVYDIVREMHGAFLEKLKPGEDLREAVGAIDRVVNKYYREGEFPRSRPGHGLGLSYEDPIVTSAFFHSWDAKDKPTAGANPIEIVPGMLMELHPSLFVPGVAGAMIGDMVAVTDSGYEILTNFPRDLIAW